MRKPGEPIYLGRHLLVLVLAVVAPFGLPRLYELVVGPLGFGTRFLAGLMIAVGAGLLLYRLYNSTAQNQP
ncbi:MAG: hypothetical protein U0231_09690 [Nitrospiraceae bacterium]